MKQSRRTATPQRPRLCFVGYGHLSRLARAVIEEFSDRAEIEVIDELFSSARSKALERDREGRVDAFVSAGFNSKGLAGAVSRPVADIKVTGYDILLALMKARQHSERVGVVTYRQTIPELDQVKALLNIEVAQHAYFSHEEARLHFEALAADGYRVIVGSSIVVELAEQVGLVGILAYSQASIRQGLHDALELARVARLETARTEQLSSVLDNLQEAVLAVDERHRVTAMNPPMEALLGRGRADLIGRPLESVAPVLSLMRTLESGLSEKGLLIPLNRREWLAHRTAIIEQGAIQGAVITLYDARSISDADTTLRSQSKGRRTLQARYTFADLIGCDPVYEQAREAAKRYARTPLTVLITGESGTGKELFAQAIHRASERADRPFVAVNCSAFPESLLESELFGYEEGAFTGARRGGKRGLFEVAHTGTLFLDEIGDMPITLQTRLLRVLQEREVLRLGGAAPVPVDVRIIAATHQALAELIDERRFRADLYYRLNILRLRLPALRERPEDILLLARSLLSSCLQRMGSGHPAEIVLRPVRDRMAAYEWPGNVRELENLCERLAILAAQLPSNEPVSLAALNLDFPELFAGSPAPGRLPVTPSEWLEQIRVALAQSGGNRQVAARQLGISRATLWRRMQELGMGRLAAADAVSHETHGVRP